MRNSACGLLVAAGLVLVYDGCRPAAQTVAISGTEELPGPAWLVGARRAGRVLLVPGDGTPRGIEAGRRDRTQGPARIQTLIYSRGQTGPAPWATMTVLPLPGAAADSVHFFVTEFAGAPVLFPRTGDSPLSESPRVPGTYLLERHDRLWLVTLRSIEQLTADTVAGIARDSLARHVREEGPHLFWASTPMWSPDGSQIVYVTNRSWMLSPRGGQEIWVVDVRTREERALLSQEARSFYPDGWLGDGVVFRSDEPGFGIVNTRGGERREIVRGSPVAFAAGRVLYMTQDSERWRGYLRSAAGTEEIPPPPRGETLLHGGAFSPSGERLLLETALEADSGITRALYLYDLRTRSLSPLLRWNHREEDRTPAGLPQWLDDSTLLLTRFDRTTHRATSSLVRLSG
jgi:hypothetical protein